MKRRLSSTAIWEKTMSEEIIKVTINGKEKEAPSGLTVHGLLKHLNIRMSTAIVEHNYNILKLEQLDEVMVNDGDNLEVVRFVGGG